MAFSTTLSLIGGSSVNLSPVTVNVLFGSDVSEFSRNDLVVSGGTAIQVTGSGSSFVAIVSPTTQGQAVSVNIPAGVIQNSGLTDVNAASNIISFTLISVKPIPVISHSIPPSTQSQFIKAQVNFGRDVTGFNPSGMAINNLAINSFNGSGAIYDIVFNPIKPGEFSFQVLPGACTDLFGNNNAASKEIISNYDSSSIDEKYGLINDNSFGIDGSNMSLSDSSLTGVELQDIQSVVDIQSLSDCAKNLPQRLLQKIAQNLFERVAGADSGKSLAQKVGQFQLGVTSIQSIIEKVQSGDETPASLAEELLKTKGLNPEALRGKLTTIARNFSSVAGIDSIISNIANLDICRMQNFSPAGEPINHETMTPSYMLPPPFLGVADPVIDNYDSAPKDNYDALMFQIKEQLETQSTEPQSPDRAKMITVVTTLAMGYHDNIGKTTDSSKDAEFNVKYKKNAADELARNSSWDPKITTQYNNRISVLGNLINNGADTIRAFINRNTSPVGDWIPMFMTAYGSASIDKTTALDQAKADRGVPGYKGFSQTQGAYGAALSRGSVASNYWKGKTVLEIRYAQDKAPVGNGRVTVHDTGGMSNNVIDYYCGEDLALYKQIQSKGVDNGGKTKPRYAAPIEVRLVSGGPRAGRTI